MGTAVKKERRKLSKAKTWLDAARMASVRVPLWRRIASRVWPSVYTNYVKATFDLGGRKVRADIKKVAHRMAEGRYGK